MNRPVKDLSFKIDDFLQAQGGCESAKVELISGNAPAESLIEKIEPAGDQIIIDEPFVFSLND